jgi:hypothetical protein
MSCPPDVYKVRAALVHKSVDEWCTLLRKYSVSYLHNQLSSLAYNESLPFPDLNMRPALNRILNEKAANGERHRACKVVYATPCATHEPAITYERQKCGGRGQTILVPVTR